MRAWVLLALANICLSAPHHVRLSSKNLKQSSHPVVQFQHDFERALEEDEDDDVKREVDAITTEAYAHELQVITGAASGPKHQRNVATTGHNLFQKYAGCRFQQANLQVQFVDFEANGRTLSNVVGCRAGTTSDKFLLAGAHYDTLPGADQPSPGAMDNGSGVAVMLMTAKAIKDFALDKTYCMAVFDGEELGCLGSGSLAKSIKADPTLSRRFVGAITSDMSTGFKPSYKSGTPAGWSKQNSKIIQGEETVGPDVDGIHIDGSPISHKLIQTFSKAALRATKSTHTPVLESEKMLWSSDHKSFVRHGFPAIDICSANHREYKYWHDQHNTTEGLEPLIGTEITKTTVVALAQLAGKRRSTADLEEEEEEPRARRAIRVPVFPHSQSMTERFGDVNCADLLSEYDSSPPYVQQEDDPSVISSLRVKASEELDEALTYLESFVKK
eukprot:c25795_g1_i1.p1 GENE.c25795_g1_i1~~c25795_g1_i1.p1  ORF type:complete len:457 (+),score=111.43 c25795_g1_i1:40-1371(+)